MKLDANTVQYIKDLLTPILENTEVKEEVDTIFTDLEKTAEFESFSSKILTCEKCELKEERKTVVVSEGPQFADLMFVGEGPGKAEDDEGRPFIGPAGQLLDKIIDAAGWQREHVYIGNVVKCRPPNNRTPKLSETAQCIGWLEKEIEMVNPKVIVCLGGTAAKTLIHPDFKITKEHGKWFEVNGRKLMAIYHPAYILRRGGDSQTELKAQVWEDIQKVKDELNG